MNFDFNFSTDYVLENEHVLIRPFKIEDLSLLAYFAIDEPTLWEFSPKLIAGEENFKVHFQEALAAKENKKEYPFIVFDKKQQQYAGSTRFYDVQLANKTVQLGYTWYGKKFQGSGLNKHCKYLLLQFAFEKMKMERVEFRAHAGNERSIAAMKTIGCVVEGIMRSCVPMPDGLRRSTIVLSILKEEWETNVKRLLKEKITK
ncbi:MAG: GNAT family protein [Bacteroidia bacterium]